MFTFTESEREFFKDMRALSTDAKGNEILVGLTLEETEFYMLFSRKFMTGKRDRDPEHRKRYRELHDKHEIARLTVLGAEIQLRNENPPRH